MKILVMSDGSSIHTQRWLQGMRQSGLENVQLLNMNPAGVREGVCALLPPERIHSICPSSISEKGGNIGYLANLFKIRRLVRDIAPDVIISVYLTSYGLMAALVKGRALLVHFMIGSDVMVAPQRGRLYLGLTRFALSRGDLFVSASQTMFERLQQIRPLPPEKVLVQQYGIEDWILDFAEQPRRYTFISNRAWVANSNIPLVMELFASTDGAATLALGGGAGSNIDGVRPELLQDPQVTLLGQLPHEQMVAAVAQSEFFFSLTSSDGTSLSLLEAMAVGAIPIVSDIPPNREWVIDGQNGFLIDLSDLTLAKQQVQRAMHLSEQQKNEMRTANRKLVRDKGSFTKNMKKFALMLEASYRANTTWGSA